VARDYDLFEKLPGNCVLWRAFARDTKMVASGSNLDAQKKTYRSGKREEVEGC
jgi:hypothetical protein